MRGNKGQKVVFQSIAILVKKIALETCKEKVVVSNNFPCFAFSQLLGYNVMGCNYSLVAERKPNILKDDMVLLAT